MSIILPQTRGVLHAGKDPYFSSVVFLSHFDELIGPEVKSAVGGHLSLGGTPATLSTTQVKFGAKSGYTGAGVDDQFTGSWTNTIPGTQDFTYEGWFYSTVITNHQGLLAVGRNSTEPAQRVYVYPAGELTYVWNGTIRIQSAASAVAINTWHFWQLRRIGTDTELALNGVKVGSTYTDTNDYVQSFPGQFWVGNSNYPGIDQALRGYTDEVRCTVGVGRAFGVPSAPFPNSG